MNFLMRNRPPTKSVNPNWAMTNPILVRNLESGIIDAYSLYSKKYYSNLGIDASLRLGYAWSFCSSLVTVIENMPDVNLQVIYHVTDLILMDHLSALDPIL